MMMMMVVKLMMVLIDPLFWSVGGMTRSQVTDFGLSRFKATSVSEKMTGQAGTYHWMAPEVRKRLWAALTLDYYCCCCCCCCCY